MKQFGKYVTDSKVCVQAFDRLCRSEFSVSPRLSTFLSTVSRFQVTVTHIAGVKNKLSDFCSRNPIDCDSQNCQVCQYVNDAMNSVVRAVSIESILAGKAKLPFTNRSSWFANQQADPDLRLTHAHLKQGTRPSKKLTNIPDVKRYLNQVKISRDGLLVVPSKGQFTSYERIVIPSQSSMVLSLLYI